MSTRHLACAAIAAFALAAAAPANALSGARAGSERSPASSRNYSDQTCKRLHDSVRQLDKQLEKEGSGYRAERLRGRKLGLEKQIDQGGCNRSLR